MDAIDVSLSIGTLWLDGEGTLWKIKSVTFTEEFSEAVCVSPGGRVETFALAEISERIAQGALGGVIPDQARLANFFEALQSAHEDDSSEKFEEVSRAFFHKLIELGADKAVFDTLPAEKADGSLDKANEDHYGTFAIEPRDFCVQNGLDFAVGNVVKYVARAGRKAYPGMSKKQSKLKDYGKALESMKYLIDKARAE